MYKEPTHANCLSQQLYTTDVENVPALLIQRHLYSGKKKKHIKELINCLSSHVVHNFRCPCGFMYVGQTKQTLKVRVAEHKVAVCNGNMDYAIARHYKEKNVLHETLDLSPFFFFII